MKKENKECKKHGVQIHYLDKSCGKTGAWKCRKCNCEKVKKRHKKIKQILVEYKGGKCEKCGYSKSVAALQFHHSDPSQKEFGIATKMYSWAIEILKKEVDKCELLCSNCHFEFHSQSD